MPRRVLLAQLLVAVVLGSGCGTDHSSGPADDRAAILQVLQQGRDAMLADDGRTACALLTEHGRRRALGFAENFDRADAATTCEDVLSREAADDPAWQEDLRGATFSVVSVRDGQATVTLRGPGPGPATVELRLVRSGGRWLVDDSNAVPEGQ